MIFVNESYIKLNHQAPEKEQELEYTCKRSDLTSLIMEEKHSAGVFL